MDNYKSIVENYIKSYNNFDVNGMVTDLDDTVLFENTSEGNVDMTLTGIEEFRAQAEQAKGFFTTRRQTITAMTEAANEISTQIAYHAVLAVDLPNGMKKGDELNFTGKSTFTFLGNKIIVIKDES
jgi:hypothetical protein